MNKKKIFLSLSLLFIILYTSHCIYDVKHIIRFKGIVVRKSIDTLQYRCGYKNKETCVGVFNRVFYKSELGQFNESLCKCQYDNINIGDTINFSGDKVQLSLWYGINWKYLKDR